MSEIFISSHRKINVSCLNKYNVYVAPIFPNCEKQIVLKLIKIAEHNFGEPKFWKDLKDNKDIQFEKCPICIIFRSPLLL